MKRPIAELWATYAEHVLAVNAGSVQTRETKRAFYAGAHSLFEKVGDISSNQTEKEAMLFMKDVQKDAVKFCDEVTQGKA